MAPLKLLFSFFFPKSSNITRVTWPSLLLLTRTTQPVTLGLFTQTSHQSTDKQEPDESWMKETTQAAVTLKRAIMTKTGLTDFLSTGALTSQEKSPRARRVGQNIQNADSPTAPPPPPGSETTGWVRPAQSILKGLLVTWGKQQWQSRSPLWEKEKTEQRALCVLTNQTESLSQSHCGGLTATLLTVQPGYHLGGPWGAELPNLLQSGT